MTSSMIQLSQHSLGAMPLDNNESYQLDSATCKDLFMLLTLMTNDKDSLVQSLKLTNLRIDSLSIHLENMKNVILQRASSEHESSAPPSSVNTSIKNSYSVATTTEELSQNECFVALNDCLLTGKEKLSSGTKNLDEHDRSFHKDQPSDKSSTHEDPNLNFPGKIGTNSSSEHSNDPFSTPDDLTKGKHSEKDNGSEFKKGTKKTKSQISGHLLRGYSGPNQVECFVCKEKLASMSQLKSHYKDFHPKIKMYQCKFCKLKFSKLHLVTRHISQEHGSRRHTHPGGERLTSPSENFSCTFCERKFAKKQYLLKHFKLHIARKSHLECSTCKLKFLSKKAHGRHVCKQNSPTEVLTVSGLSNSDRNGNMNVQGNVREDCGSEFQSSTVDSAPKRSCKMIAQDSISCLLKFQSFKAKPTSRNPQIEQSSQSSNRESEQSSQIEQSSRSLNLPKLPNKMFKKQVNLHKRKAADKLTKNEKEKLKKLKSNKEVKSSSLTTGNKCKTNKKGKSASKMAASVLQTTSDSTAMSHRLSDSSSEGISSFSCIFCSKTFNSMQSLSNHRRCHLLERRFECNFCPKKFPFRSRLARHLIVHTRQFVCGFCDKKFKCKASLKTHVSKFCPQHRQPELENPPPISLDTKQIDGADPLSCPTCHENLRDGCNLKEHECKQNMSAKDPTSCPKSEHSILMALLQPSQSGVEKFAPECSNTVPTSILPSSNQSPSTTPNFNNDEMSPSVPGTEEEPIPSTTFIKEEVDLDSELNDSYIFQSLDVEAYKMD